MSEETPEEAPTIPVTIIGVGYMDGRLPEIGSTLEIPLALFSPAWMKPKGMIAQNRVKAHLKEVEAARAERLAASRAADVAKAMERLGQ